MIDIQNQPDDELIDYAKNLVAEKEGFDPEFIHGCQDYYEQRGNLTAKQRIALINIIEAFDCEDK